MQEPDNFLKEEWEAVILAGVLLISVICLGLSFFRAPRQQNFSTESAAGNRYQPLLNKDAFAFLTQNPDGELSRNPFQFQIRVAIPEAKAASPVGKITPEKTGEVQPVLETAEIPEELVEEAAKVVQQPVYQLMRKRLTYLYSQADNTGKTSAVIKISSVDGREELHTPGAGDKVLGMTVLSIGAEKLSLLDASGRQVNIPFGEAKTVVVREQQ